MNHCRKLEVTENPNTPLEALEILAEDNSYVRSRVLHNPKITPRIFKLAKATDLFEVNLKSGTSAVAAR